MAGSAVAVLEGDRSGPGFTVATGEEGDHLASRVHGATARREGEGQDATATVTPSNSRFNLQTQVIAPVMHSKEEAFKAKRNRHATQKEENVRDICH